MDIFSTNVLAKVVERLHTPSSFLLDTFFPNVQTSDKEEIFFDVTDSKLLPAKTVIMGAKDGLEGTRCYGAIHDEKANWTAHRYFTKSWVEEDPSVRWLLLQSAPLVVPYRPNASLCATIG